MRGACRMVSAFECAVLAAVLAGAGATAGARLLIPMDLTQTDHLKAYGVAYRALEQGENAEWLLNYRGGSFLIEDTGENRRTLLERGVLFQAVSGRGRGAGPGRDRRQQHGGRGAGEGAAGRRLHPAAEVDEPWDDAVDPGPGLRRDPLRRLWDDEVLAGSLAEYDWLHLHHEDFTGQYGKFYASYRSAAWYLQQPAGARSRRPRRRLRQGLAAQARRRPRASRTTSPAAASSSRCAPPPTRSTSRSPPAAWTSCDVVYDGDPPDPGRAGEARLHAAASPSTTSPWS